jgi:hypothetical protein
MQQEEHKTQTQVPKLLQDGSNWVIYCDRLKWALQMNSFDDHTSADSPPVVYVALGDIGGVGGVGLLACWNKEELLIKQVLGSMLPDTAFNRIKATTTMHGAWEILKCVFEECSKALVTDLIRCFRNKWCEEDKSVHAHFEHLADLREQLAAIGKAVTDDNYTDTVFASLPASYDSAISFLSASARLGSKTLTAEIFKQFILDEFECWQVKTKYSESKDKALAADSGKGKGKDKHKDKHKVECFNCHKTGHYKSNCWEKGGGKEGQGPKHTAKAQRTMQQRLRRRPKNREHGPPSRRWTSP